MNLPPASKIVIITDGNVAKLYGESLAAELGAELLIVPPGECSKTREKKQFLEDALFEMGCDRDALLIALGGGVVGDLTGYVAATYMRGIRFIQMPSTLLAMVDSSIGGKTGINTDYGKNLIGAIWQPVEIVRNIDFLKTLPDEHMTNGLVEALKVFLTHDADSLNFLELNLDAIFAREPAILEELVERAARIKHAVVERDEREGNERRVLNFGHTVGHALEKLSNYELLHGYAVALGILVEAKMAELDGHLSPESFAKILELFAKLGISPDQIEHDADAIISKLKHDKKTKNGVANYTILTGLGAVHTQNGEFAHELKEARLREALSSFNK
jgi:3-dehydroquinate synthase